MDTTSFPTLWIIEAPDFPPRPTNPEDFFIDTEGGPNCDSSEGGGEPSTRNPSPSPTSLVDRRRAIESLGHILKEKKKRIYEKHRSKSNRRRIQKMGS